MKGVKKWDNVDVTDVSNDDGSETAMGYQIYLDHASVTADLPYERCNLNAVIKVVNTHDCISLTEASEELNEIQGTLGHITNATAARAAGLIT